MYKQIMALNDQQCLICYKTQPNQNTYIFKYGETGFSWYAIKPNQTKPNQNNAVALLHSLLD